MPCASLPPFRWSAADTRQTQDQATEYNAVVGCACGWRPIKGCFR